MLMRQQVDPFECRLLLYEVILAAVCLPCARAPVGGSAGLMGLTKLIVRGARQHNLKNISVEIPRNTLTVITGLSGSGKSSLAFDTIYAEGQRRYVESLSAYARQFLDQMERPEVDVIEGLSPSIAIEQKTTTRSPLLCFVNVSSLRAG